MAKKKEKVSILDHELTPTVLGEVEGHKKRPFLLISIFLIFILVIYFAPYINKVFNINTEVEPTPLNKIPVEEKENPIIEEEIKKDTKYSFSDSLYITTDHFDMHMFSFLNNVLTFHIKGTTKVDLANHNYFLEIYSSEGTLLKRIMLDKEKLKEDDNYKYSYDLVADNIKEISVKEINKSDYPQVTLIKREDGDSLLVCKKGKNINYYFNDEGLYLIQEEMYSSDIDYEERYKYIEGVVVNKEEGILITYHLNNIANISSLNNSNIYAKGVTPSVIKFEMESNDFRCEV